jgi:signal transduction histidine kinase
MLSRMSRPQVSRLLSLASHELRTPANVVVGYLRMALGERAGPLTPQQRHMLEQAERSCARMVQLLADMSELARLEAGEAQFERTRVALDTLIDEVVSAFVSPPDSEVTAAREGDPSGAFVKADAGRLRRALLACTTAIGREIGIEGVVVLRVSPPDDAGMLTLVIRDRRRRSAHETAAPASRAFDEFKGGLGLELPLARRAIEAEGGVIWADVTGDGLPAAHVRLPVLP